MNQIPPATPCFLIHLSEHAALDGRVVETVREQAPDQYVCVAGWVHEIEQATELLVRRENLLPLSAPAGPAPAKTARRKAPSSLMS